MLTGLILAGSSEAQGDCQVEALLPYNGGLLIHTQIREMQEVCEEIIVATPDPRPFLRNLDPGIRIITDFYRGRGPLGGMYAGLSLSKHSNIWTVGCDMPYISAAAASLLLECKQEGYEAAIPWIGGVSYPLHGVYDKSCARYIQTLINNGDYRPASLIRRLNSLDILEHRFEEMGLDLGFVRSLDEPGLAPDGTSRVESSIIYTTN
ncbi:molybdenum cofactor guanylyltransferase [Paenibacillus sp. YPG26]|uniref:molybdenum cofactor guanylyltransferase n=1 Tax=Paenibacillus sp. YPG26 TaxID=2878915 RepID=UPI00203C56E5|nr:molybdenum cofactor guanylyltransferase [Paenibacillus sp. YPG26]USB32293.1 molybdenum cofactor guanylyltransferase [Paenibacillus sp. YPG26]